MRRLVLAGVLSGVLAGAAGTADAAELSVRGPVPCVDAAELSFRVERAIGMPLAQAAPLTFAVEMERGADGFVARIRVAGESTRTVALERVLTDRSCARLADAVAVAIALALGSDAAATSPSDATRGPPSDKPPPDATLARADSGVPSPDATLAPADSSVPTADDPAPSEASEAPSGDAWIPSLSVWLLGDVGSLPAPGLGAAVAAELAARRFSLQALGTLLFEQHTELDSALSPAPGARLQLFTGSLLACIPAFDGSATGLTARACLGLELGRLAGEGTDVPEPRRGGALWVAPRVDAGAVWSVPDSPLRLAVTVTGAVPLNRNEFELTDLGTVHRPPNVVGRLSFGVGVAFR
jgi:hypothetical protein